MGNFLKMNETTLVQCRFRTKTMQKIDHLVGVLNYHQRVDAIVASVNIAKLVVDTVDSGGLVILEKADGSQTVLVLETLPNNKKIIDKKPKFIFNIIKWWRK